MTPLLEVAHLRKSFAAGFRRRRVVLHDLSFGVAAGEVVALVGESGSGKSTAARLVAGLEKPDAGRLRIDGAPLTPGRDGRVQLVFQDPFASLNPVHTVEYHLRRPLVRLRADGPVAARIAALLQSVGLDAALASRHPDQLSGGQRQRVSIARALAAAPQVLLADEPTSMLDVSTRAGVLELLRGLANQQQLAILLITHDLASAGAIADRILVLQDGRLVESGRTQEVLRAPVHPYTRRLLHAVPRGERWSAAGAEPSPVHDPDQSEPLPRSHQA
jgi:ABC-type glutathione transport system ATPase component